MGKIVIGTANFNQKYGLEKKKFNPKKNISKFINTLKQSKINIFDTAVDYELDFKLARKFNKRIKIITKLKLPKKNSVRTFVSLENKIINELRKKRIRQFEAILVHNVNDLKSKKGQMFLKLLYKLKKLKKTKFLGISVYEPIDLDLALSIFRPDIIQFPLSLLNNTFLGKKTFNKLKNSKAILQARSIFLQGLMIKTKKELTKLKINNKLKLVLYKFINYCNKKKITQLEAALLYLKQLKRIDLITVGIDNNEQLSEII